MSRTKIRSPHNSPQQEIETAAAIRELAFEISDSGQMKLLIAVADYEEQRRFDRELARECVKEGVRIKAVEVSDLKPQSLLSFLITKTGKGGALSLLGFSGVSKANRLKLFASLNFHRDAILELPLALVIWLTPDEAFQLPAQAPDLWSRRTAVYNLSFRSPQTLIRKLFESSPIPRETWTGKDALSECLESLLSKEAQLSQCQTLSSQVDISRAKDSQVALLEASSKLLQAAQSDRKVELSLWLWNLASIDSVLQSWLAKLSQDDRRAFESMYLDRNEILLALAEKMPIILKKYRSQITKNLGVRKAISILNIFMTYADDELDKIAQQLHFVTHPDMYGLRQQFDINALPRSIISEITSEELEKWLSGLTRKRPRYLDAIEGDLLKALYNGKPVLEEAYRFGVSQERIFKLIENLEIKVRLILGASSRLRISPTPVIKVE